MAKSKKKIASKSKSKISKSISKSKTGRSKVSGSVAKKAKSNKTGSKVNKLAKTTSAAVKLVAKITPLEDRLLIALDLPEETTAGGIFIPFSGGEKPGRGQVVAKGCGKRNKKGTLKPLDVGVGDKVLFGEYSGTKVQIDGAEFLILREDEVLGIVT